MLLVQATQWWQDLLRDGWRNRIMNMHFIWAFQLEVQVLFRIYWQLKKKSNVFINKYVIGR